MTEQKKGRPSKRGDLGLNPRSQSYQSTFCEARVPAELLDAFAAEESVFKRLNPFDYNDEVIELQEQLRIEFWRLVNNLTDRQRTVLRLIADGYTQCQVGKMCSVNQSSVTKALNGNVDYRNGKTVYGGIKTRLKKLIDKDEKIQEILARIAELRDESWF